MNKELIDFMIRAIDALPVTYFEEMPLADAHKIINAARMIDINLSVMIRDAFAENNPDFI